MKCTQVDGFRSWWQFQNSDRLSSQPKSKIGWLNLLDNLLSANSLFNPYLAECEHRSWIVSEKNIILGRITAILAKDDSGKFGFFNCVDDTRIASILTSKAEDWLKSKGASDISGPFNPTMYNSCGLLKYSENAISYGYPDTPHYLINCLEQCGYVEVNRLHTFHQTKETYEKQSADNRIRSFVKSFTSNDMNLVFSGWRNFSRDCKWTQELINSCWKSNYGFEKISEKQIGQIIFKINFMLPKGSLCFIEKGGSAIALSLVLPDANEIANDLRPSLGIFNLPQLILRLKLSRARNYRIALLGVLPSYQSTTQGLAAALTMVDHHIRECIKKGGKSIDIGWILDDNPAMLRFLKMYRVSKTMEHCIMGKRL